MRRSIAAAAATAVLFATPGSAAVQRADAQPPAQLQRLLGCRSIADSVERLACFDRESSSTEAAVQQGDLVAVDREKVRQTKRSLFGFSVPDLGLFGGDDKDEVKEIEGVIAAVGMGHDGYRVRLQDGSRWAQTDGKRIALEPRVGDKVVIRRGALGSFIMRVAGQSGVKVERLG